MKRILTPFLFACLFTSARLAAAAGEAGFVSIFNGQDLAGWDGKPGWWSVEDGAITAQSTLEKPCAKHNYLIWRGGQPADFELWLKFRLHGGNSGIQFRSHERPDWDTSGYQADMDAEDQYTGGVYEHTRGVIAPRGQNVVIAPDGTRQVTSLGDPAKLRNYWKLDEWNDYRIVARGSEITLYINGVLTAKANDHQTNQAAGNGIIALQMHPGPPMKVQFKDVRLKVLTNAAAGQSVAPTRSPRGIGARNPDSRPVGSSHGASQRPHRLINSRLPGDFEVESLCSPSKTQGSWFSMCMNLKGRLIVCDQYYGDLFRVTPASSGGPAGGAKVGNFAWNQAARMACCEHSTVCV